MYRRIMPAFALVLSLFAVACDNPIEHEEHPVGLAVLDAQQNVVASGIIGQETTGEIAVAAGATQTFTVVALGEDGDQLPVTGELEVRVAQQPTNATLTLTGDQLAVSGTTAGAGTTTLLLFHDEHEELQRTFPVVVQ